MPPIFLVTGVALLFSLASCSTPFTEEMAAEKGAYRFISSPSGMQADMAHLDVRDGIDMREACFLSDLYFLRYEGYCGAAGPLKQTKTHWIFDTVVGYGGTPGNDIRIDKVSGRIDHRGKPSSIPPWSDITVMATRE